jgi:hypothetical protein
MTAIVDDSWPGKEGCWLQNARMVKIFEGIGGMGSEMMGSLHEEELLGAATWVRDGTGESTASSAERVSRGRESHFARSPTEAVAANRTAKVYASGDRKAVGPEGPAADRVCGATRYDPNLVPATHRTEV